MNLISINSPVLHGTLRDKDLEKDMGKKSGDLSVLLEDMEGVRSNHLLLIPCQQKDHLDHEAYTVSSFY